MDNYEIRQDALLGTMARLHGFKVDGIYDNGLRLITPTTKGLLTTLDDRLLALKSNLAYLLLNTYEVKVVILNPKYIAIRVEPIIDLD